MKELILVEEVVVRQHEIEVVIRVKKMLMMSFPCDFSESILEKYSDEFRLVDLEIVALVGWDDELGIAHVKKWRERERERESIERNG
jgi:hypothetical protein